MDWSWRGGPSMAYGRAWPPAAWEQDQGTWGVVGESPCAHPGAVISFLLLQLLSQLRGSVDYKLFYRGSSILLSLQHSAGFAWSLLEQLSGSGC